MSFTVLSDSNVKEILGALSPSDVSKLIQTLVQALVQYSCDGELQYQPERAVVTRPGGQVSLFMPATSPNLIGVKIVGVTPSGAQSNTPKGSAPPPGLKSILTLCDATGLPIGSLNAAELTAFRTALGSMLLYQFRKNTENIVVFGAGKQALWHIKLALLLREKDIRSVTIVNRSKERTQELIDTLSKDSNSQWPSHIELKVFDEQGDRDSALESLVVDADVIFCTTPSTQPLFPAAVLTSEKAREKTRYLAAIGSYRLDMQEIDPEYLKAVTDPKGDLAASAYQEGVITVDTREGCLHEAGELVKAEIPTDKMLEIGRIFQSDATVGDAKLKEWLETGLVIYKSVGTGVMDLAIGQHLLDLAKTRNVGLTAEDF